MPQTHVPLLVISGPVGVGKTTVGYEASALLTRRRIPHTFVDLDGLAQTHPRPKDDRFGERLALRNLRGVWANCAAAGSRNLIVARVVERQADLDRIADVVPDAKPFVCQLRAADETLVERVRRREVGPETRWHEERALQLSRSLSQTAPADHRIGTDGRTVTDIAQEIVELVGWRTAGG